MQYSDILLHVFLTMGFFPSWSKRQGVAASPKEGMPEKCGLPPKYGRCKESFQNFYYDPKTILCRTFIYSGCGGNENNFPNLLECLYGCERFVLRMPWSYLAGGLKWVREIPRQCKLPRRRGWCKAELHRYYYDYLNSRCRPFIYSGCRGNVNNFLSYKDCAWQCEPFGSVDYSKNHEWNPDAMADTCELPVDVGICKAAFPRFYYDRQTKSCKPFSFGGCNGNSNNFLTMEDCARECGGSV
uniref:Carboxypeptidase inhibitor SmCI-like n=1 Tax=Pogona vitticeps TaxID=103695 RepID=A0ABM5EPT0_9SAUR